MGEVLFVSEGPAREEGVSSSWVMSHINGEVYTEELLEACMALKVPYDITFAFEKQPIHPVSVTHLSSSHELGLWLEASEEAAEAALHGPRYCAFGFGVENIIAEGDRRWHI